VLKATLLKLLMIAAIALVVGGTIVLVTCKYENPCKKPKTQNADQALTSAVQVDAQAHPDKTKDETGKGTDCVPCWHKLLAWPEGITVWVVLLTLVVIGWQSWETRKSAGAVLESGRAWVIVRPVAWSPELRPLWEQGDPIIDDTTLQVVAHVFPAVLTNAGETPAFIDEIAASYLILREPPENLPAKPAYEFHPENGRILTVTDEFPLNITLVPIPTLTKAQVQSFRSQQSFLYAYGCVRYRDVHGRSHETRFGYVYNFPQGGMVTFYKNEFMVTGPPKYNRMT
jgi:hypothetical protein